MTKGAPSDDFFGIEYVSSSCTGQEQEKERSQIEEAPRPSKNDAKQLPGSKFMDQAFFPEIMKRSSNEDVIEEKPKSSGTDFLEDQYFSGLEGSGKQQFSDKFYEKIGLKSDFEQKIPSPTMEKSHHELFYDEHSHEKAECGPDVAPLAQNYLEGQRKRRQAREKDSEVLKVQEKRSDKRKRRASRCDFEVSEKKDQQMSVIQTLRASMPPVQSFSQDLLVEYLANRIIFQNTNLIAFDKPYGLPYSGSSQKNQFDRLLQVLKARVAPKVERLHLVRSLDNHQSGIILFATNATAQTEAQDQLKEATLTHRCLVKGVLDESIEITTPLVKKLYRNKGQPQFKLLPLFTNQTQKQISHGTTLLKPLHWGDGVSYLEAETKNEVPHQLRCHLGLAKLTLFDDQKYGSSGQDQPMRMPKAFLNRVGLTETQGRKLPMLSHLQQMRLPSAHLQKPDIVIRAPLPPHFTWLLQKIKFLKR